MEESKKHYLKVLLLLDDIQNYHTQLLESSKAPLSYKLRLIKNVLVPLDILRDSFVDFGVYIKTDDIIKEKSKYLKKRVEFINHLRNKIGAHLENIILEKAVQWEPNIFWDELKKESDKEDLQLILTYKALLESGVNTYIDASGTQKFFGKELDLFYPPDIVLFYNFLGELNEKSIEFLRSILPIIENQIRYWSEEEKMEMSIKAGKTDFNLKSTGESY